MHRVAAFLAISSLAGCSGGGSTGPDNSGTGTKTTTTTTLAGTFADSKSSGALAVSIASQSAVSALVLPAGISAQAIASGTATGTLTFLSGGTATVNGSYTASTGALTLSGGGYSFNGSIASGAVSGSYTGPNGTGNYSAQAPSSSGAVAKTYCGTYGAGGDYGWFNMVIGGSGNVSGLAVTLLGATSVGFTGTLVGSTISATTTANVQIQATLSADGNTVTGAYVPVGATAGTGSFLGTTSGCTTVGASTFAGLWATTVAATGTNLHFALTQSSGAAATGSGIITVSFVPGWTGNEFEVTSNTFDGSQLSFTASLGANPTGTGGFWYGTLSFSGTITNGTTMTGTVTFTPPRTLTQTFAQQTVTGVTLTRN
jgi:hypothetical protein